MKQVDFQPNNKAKSVGRFESGVYPEMTGHPDLRRPTVEVILHPNAVTMARPLNERRPRMQTQVYDFRKVNWSEFK